MNRIGFFFKGVQSGTTAAGLKAVLCGLLLTLAATGTVEAQYYPAPPGGGYYRPAPPPEYYQQRRHRQQPYYSPYQDDGYVVRRRRAYGSVCVTSRGSCQVRPVALPAGCKCFIPGFGTKRGAVQ